MRNNNGTSTSTLLFRLYYRKQCAVQYYFWCNLTLLLFLRDHFISLVMFTYLENVAQSGNRDLVQFENNLAHRLYYFWTRFNKTLNSWTLSKFWFELLGINIKPKTGRECLNIFENNEERFLVTTMCYNIVLNQEICNILKDTKIPTLLSSIFSHEDRSLFSPPTIFGPNFFCT